MDVTFGIVNTPLTEIGQHGSCSSQVNKMIKGQYILSIRVSLESWFFLAKYFGIENLFPSPVR